MQVTLFFAFLTFIFVAAVSFFVWRTFREQIAFLYWSASALLTALGWGLLVLPESWLSSGIIRSLSDALTIAGHVAAYLALALLGTKTISTYRLSSWGIFVALFFVLDAASHSLLIPFWGLAVPVVHGILTIMMIGAVLGERLSQNRGIVYSMVVVFMLNVLAVFKKAFDVLIGRDTAVIMPLTNENSAIVMGATLMVSVGTLGFALMSFTRTATSLRELASIDSLTRVLNRHAWDREIESERKRVRRGRPPFSVIMVDLDLFKEVNDKYGHAAGDETLKAAARVIGSNLREIDVLSRYGGEEFLALVVETPAAEAVRVAERIRQSVAATPIEFNGQKFSITCSAGVAEYDPASDTADSAVARADKAMYRAKSEGRNRVVVAKG